MKSKFDLKSGLAGLCAGALVVIGVGAAVPQHHCGRFEVAGSGAFFVITDTATGQSWYGDFHATINNPVPSQWSGPDAQARFFEPKITGAD